jgi:lysophospholipase L1-like esterase
MRGRLISAVLVAGCLLALAAFAGAAEEKNLLKDPGFESAQKGALAQWSTPSYWQGSLKLAAQKGQPHAGRSCAELAATEKGGKWMGRVLNTRQVATMQGARYMLSMWAKGSGQLVLGCIEYGKKDGKTSYHYAPSETPAGLTNDWQEVVFHYTPQEPTATSVAVYAEVQGEQGRALLDDAFFGLAPLPGYSMVVRPSHTMAPQGGKVAFEIEAKSPPGAAFEGVLVQHLTPSGLSEQKTVSPGADGKGTYEFSTDAKTEPGPHAFTVVLKKVGIAEVLYVDVTDPATYKAFAAAAGAVRIEKPAHLMFVGDSLTALFRGYNYVDKVRGWLQQKYGPEVQVTNAGVGGDYTTRVLARLEKDVLTQNPTRVFIFLGHNDSKLKSATDYKEAVVPPETFDKEYREIVRLIRTKTKAKVTIISATSSVYEITKATADAARKAGRAHNLFGKPEALEQFNAIAKKVAADLGCGYLDVYEPMRTHPDKKSLFTADGVHISNEGNRLVALEILKYLGR